MSDHEFENYLALLTRLLKLRGTQQARLAAELRAHLEDRLEELLARGVPREEAVKRALEEFGDAAGLAGEFVSISRNKRRRWLMRLTTFSVAATFLIAAGIATFWPGRNAAPGVAAVVAQVAQDPFGPASAGAKQAAVKADAAKADASQAGDATSLPERLNQRIDVEFVETPLRDVIAFLGDSTLTKFHLDLRALDATGTSRDTPVTFQMKQVRLATALDLILGDLDLTSIEKDDILVITSHEVAKALLEIRVYDCRDLLGWPAIASGKKAEGNAPIVPGGSFPSLTPGTITPAGPQVPPPPTRVAPAGAPSLVPPGIQPQFGAKDGAKAGGAAAEGGFWGPNQEAKAPPSEHDARAERLMNIVTTNVDPQSWTDQGGPGSISEYNGLIVVTQTAQTHKKVERVLDMLREAAGIAEPEPVKRKVVR